MQTVRDVMQEKVITIRYDRSVTELATLLEDHGISGVPVVDADGRLLGVVSRTDIASAAASRGTGEDLPDRPPGYYFDLVEHEEYQETVSMEDFSGAVRVEDIMTPYVVDIEEDAPLSKLIDRMLEAKVHRIIVTRLGEIVGLVSTTDLMKAFRRTLA